MAPFALAASAAQALGLGEIAQQSALGASLRIVVPVMVGAGEDIAPECIRLAPSERRGDGIPEVTSARLTLERTPSGARIVVSSPRAVSDPLLRVTLQIGCEGGVRREYTMMMDPLPIDVPVAAPSAVAAPASVPVPVAPRIAAAPAAGSRAGGAAEKSARSATMRQRPAMAAAPATNAGPTAPSKSAAAPAKSSPPAAGTAVAKAPQPKLTVSAAVPPVEPQPDGKGGVVAGPGASQDPANATLDAEAAALQRRVAELTALVDKMQGEIRAAETQQAAQATRLAAEKAAQNSPQATLTRWWDENWPFLAGIVALAALIAMLLSARRRRATAAASPWQATVPGGDRPPAPARPPSAAAAATQPQAKPAQVTSAKPSVTVSPPTTTNVDVSELSHVTEEAGVYLAFNRPDRAIDVLQEHIRTAAHSLPAAWLMLLDVFHAQGREPEFRELAAKFHTQFNAQEPSWDAYRRQAQNDRGVEGVPHIVRQLVASWGKPDCRDLLEHLLRENRDGRRTGFSLAAYEDILFLRQLADNLAGGAEPGGTTRAPAGTAPQSVPASAAALVAKAKRPPTLDLELALDEDMLDAGKAPKPGGDATGTDKPKGD